MQSRQVQIDDGDIRTQLAPQTNMGTFYFAGSVHTSLGDESFYTRGTSSDAGTVTLPSWGAGQLAGHATNAGP